MIDNCFYMSIDTEGMELSVLRGVDFSIFRPKIIEVEIKKTSLSKLAHHEIARLLDDNGYSPVAKGLLNAIFIDQMSAQFDWLPIECRG
jgi:hypothetical protein